MCRLIYIALTFSLTFSYANAVYAEAHEDLFDLTLKELLNLQVTGSTLTEQTIISAPSAVTVFDSTLISSLGVDYLHELLNYVAGFQSHRNPDTPNAYGYSARGRRNGNPSKEVLLVMDGLILNDPRTGSANGAWRMFSVQQIEKVEIIRGPGSALYGSGAYSGVINISTYKQVSTGQIQVGQKDRLAVSGNTYQSLNNWQLNVFAGYEEDQGETYLLDDNFNNDPSIMVTTKDPMQNADLQLSINNDATTLGYVYHDARSEGLYSLEALSPDFNSDQTRMQMLHGKQLFSLTDNIKSYLSVSLTQVDQYFDAQATAPGALAAISSPSSNDALFLKVNLKSRGLRMNWHNDWQSTQNTSVQFGVDWQVKDEMTSEAANNFNADQLAKNEFPIDYYGDFSNVSSAKHQELQKTIGLYGQSIIKANDTNQFNVGLRFDRNQVDQSHISPRIGWVHELSFQHTIKLLYGEAFRAASLNETANPDSPILRGSTDLDHEVIKTLDVIYLHQKKNINMQLGLFFNEYFNPIVVEISDDNVRQYTNGVASSAQGLEAEINYYFSQTTTARMTYYEMFNKPDDFFREASRHASLMINWQRNAWQGNLSAVYGGEKEMTSGSELLTLDDYSILSGKLSYRVNSALDINIQVKNIFDERYYSAPQGNRLIQGIPNKGMETRLQFNYLLN
jgi:iron complex outermembrane receptor protein